MSRDVHAVLLRSLPTLYEGQTLDTLPQHIVSFVSRLVAANALAYNEVDLRRGSAKMLITPDEFTNSPHLSSFERYMDQHPLIRHQQTTGDISARKISDFVSQREFRRTPLYNEVYRHLDAADQFAFALRSVPGRIIAIALNRARCDFTEEDRQLLNLVQPHLIQAFHNAEALTSLQNELRALRGLANDFSFGLIILNRRSHIQFATPRARRLLKKYFPESPAARRLPPTVAEWLQRTCRWHGCALPNATDAFTVSRPSGTLTLRRIHFGADAETMLRLEEAGVPLSAKPLEALNLTPRQAEVLLWVAQGKSNPEIAIILGTARRTVQKHLEFIFARLGVESRTAAARRALEILNSNPI